MREGSLTCNLDLDDHLDQHLGVDCLVQSGCTSFQIFEYECLMCKENFKSKKDVYKKNEVR